MDLPQELQVMVLSELIPKHYNILLFARENRCPIVDFLIEQDEPNDLKPIDLNVIQVSELHEQAMKAVSSNFSGTLYLSEHVYRDDMFDDDYFANDLINSLPVDEITKLEIEFDFEHGMKYRRYYHWTTSCFNFASTFLRNRLSNLRSVHLRLCEARLEVSDVRLHNRQELKDFFVSVAVDEHLLKWIDIRIPMLKEDTSTLLRNNKVEA